MKQKSKWWHPILAIPYVVMVVIGGLACLILVLCGAVPMGGFKDVGTK